MQVPLVVNLPIKCMEKALQILKDVFGYDQFRDTQSSIIEHVLHKKDALVIMPTGGGKSLCYQIPALVQPNLTIVVSPLIALMNDQVNTLKQLGIEAEALHSNLDENTSRGIFELINNNRLKLLYVSPERLMSEGFVQYLAHQKIDLIAIDEAHCVSVWGNDFRPEYVKLGQLKTLFPDTPTIALTATADALTQEDIIKQLKLIDSQLFLSSFERKNILIKAQPGQQRIEQIIQFLTNKTDQCGIIYCLSRKNTESVSEKLRAKGFNSAAYHAGLNGDERSLIQRRFQDDEINIICATIAFGMGIDKSNIRFVIHYNLPKNIEGFYQEIGRAGRDGDDSESLLFYSWADRVNLQKFIDMNQARDSFKSVQSSKLERMWQFATSSNCRTNTILNYFGEYKSEPCGHCDNCLYPPPQIDGTTFTQMALSAIIRTKEKVGINMLIDILRGSYKQELVREGFDQIKTYGVGRDIDFLSWNHYLTQMINQGIIRLDISDYSRLKTTPLSKEVLQGKTVQLSEFKKEKQSPKVKTKKLDLLDENINQSILQKLKTWRANQAKTQKVPAYVIFHDKTLKGLAAIKADNIKTLLQVNGMGKVKYEKYSEELWALIQDN